MTPYLTPSTGPGSLRWVWCLPRFFGGERGGSSRRDMIWPVEVEVWVCLSGMKKPWRRDHCWHPMVGLPEGSTVRRAVMSLAMILLEKFSFQHPEEQKCLSQLHGAELSAYGCLSPCCRRGSLHQQMNKQQFDFLNF